MLEQKPHWGFVHIVLAAEKAGVATLTAVACTATDAGTVAVLDKSNTGGLRYQQMLERSNISQR
jgi:hypothetical protein